MGGELVTKSRVDKIIVKNKRATGVEMENGEKHYGRYIISNADTKQTFLKLIDDHNLKDKIKDKINNIELTLSGFVVHLGVDMDLSGYDLNYGTVFFSPSEKIENIFNEVNHKMSNLGDLPDFSDIAFGISVPSLHDESIAPEGKHCLDIIAPCIPFNFKNNWLTGDELSRGKEYKLLKEQFADGLIKAAEQIIPDLSEHIVQKDISTPLTYNRYTLSSEGSWYDIAKIPGQKSRGPLSEVKGLYTTGNKSYPGSGVFGATLSGILTAVAVDKRNFPKEINSV
jgi:phytoene dehydrogenase-like protein